MKLLLKKHAAERSWRERARLGDEPFHRVLLFLIAGEEGLNAAPMAPFENLRFSILSSSGELPFPDPFPCSNPSTTYKKITHKGWIFCFCWGGGIRTPASRDQNPLPYRLATPQCSIFNFKFTIFNQFSMIKFFNLYPNL